MNRDIEFPFNSYRICFHLFWGISIKYFNKSDIDFY